MTTDQYINFKYILNPKLILFNIYILFLFGQNARYKKNYFSHLTKKKKFSFITSFKF